MAWIKEEGIKNEKGKPIGVGKQADHYFLTDLYIDQSQKIAIRKPSQVGVSTWVILTSIHDAKYWGINQIHTLPTAADVGKFVPSKTNEIIKVNPTVRMGIKEKEVDAVSQKQFGKGFIYYKGTFSEREALMLTSDRNWYDEVDKSDQKALGDYASRLESADSLKQERWLSTPTVSGFGIDRVFETSDQKHWRFNCGHCRMEQHMTWENNVDLKEGKYVCKKCYREITHDMMREGKWVPRFPGRETSGYWVNQMMAPWVLPSQLVKAYRQAEAGQNDMTMEYFYNHKLGMPYMDEQNQINRSFILNNLINAEHGWGETVIGVDVQQDELYVIGGNTEGVYIIAVLRDENKTKWERLEEIMEVYKTRFVVIDAGYKPNDVLEFARKYPYRVYMNWYKDDPKKAKIVRYGDEVDFTKKSVTFEEEIKILTERDRMIDFLLNDLKNGKIRFFYKADDKVIQRLIAHCETTYARMVTDRLGMEKREWVSTGKDDFLHALIYFRIALMKQEHFNTK